MVKINGLVELPDTLILSSVDKFVMVDQTNLTHIRDYVQESQETLKIL